MLDKVAASGELEYTAYVLYLTQIACLVIILMYDYLSRNYKQDKQLRLFYQYHYVIETAAAGFLMPVYVLLILGGMVHFFDTTNMLVVLSLLGLSIHGIREMFYYWKRVAPNVYRLIRTYILPSV